MLKSDIYMALGVEMEPWTWDLRFGLDMPFFFPTKFSQSPFPYLQNENIWLNYIHVASPSWSETIINHTSILEHTIF